MNDKTLLEGSDIHELRENLLLKLGMPLESVTDWELADNTIMYLIGGLHEVIDALTAERDAAIDRAEAAEAQLRAMMEGEAYEWIRNHPEIDSAIDAAVGLPVDNTEE